MLLARAIAKARDPGIRTAEESKIGALIEPEPVRFATNRQARSGAFASKIGHRRLLPYGWRYGILPQTTLDGHALKAYKKAVF